MGSLICYIFPSSLLLYVAGSNTEYRNRARVRRYLSFGYHKLDSCTPGGLAMRPFSLVLLDTYNRKILGC